MGERLPSIHIEFDTKDNDLMAKIRGMDVFLVKYKFKDGKEKFLQFHKKDIISHYIDENGIEHFKIVNVKLIEEPEDLV